MAGKLRLRIMLASDERSPGRSLEPTPSNFKFLTKRIDVFMSSLKQVSAISARQIHLRGFFMDLSGNSLSSFLRLFSCFSLDPMASASFLFFFTSFFSSSAAILSHACSFLSLLSFAVSGPRRIFGSDFVRVRAWASRISYLDRVPESVAASMRWNAC